MKLIGITGQIGCGKTTIAEILRKEGFVVFDADKACRALYLKSAFLEKVKQIFPETFVNGVFNKKILREMVFANQAKLKLLESVIHPLLKQTFLNLVHKNSKRDVLIFVDAALLFEMGWDRHCTDIILATAPRDVQKKRVMERDGITAEQFENIVTIQKASEKRQLACADYILETDRSLGVLKTSLLKIVGSL